MIGTTVPTINVSATALRFFFKITLKRHDLAEEVVSTREPRRLPVVLSPEEVGRLLAAATNIKHKAILSLAYATGLRASEVVSLKLTDIDRDRMVIRVEQGKGKKDRYVILSPILLEILREWWRAARKKGWMSAAQPWLFPGCRGQHASARQLHRIVRLAAGRAGITKRVRGMLQRFKSARSAQRFLSMHAAVHNTFNFQRHLISRSTLRVFRAEATAEWRNAVAAA